MNSKLQGGMSLCQSFLRLPVTKQVRKKCHCCILAEDKMLLLVQELLELLLSTFLL